MFASRYWYQYDSVVFGVPRFWGYIYLYQKLLLTWLTNLPKLSFCFLFVALGQKLTEILIFKLKCGENRICTFLWVLMGFIYFRWPYTYIACSEFWQH